MKFTIRSMQDFRELIDTLRNKLVNGKSAESFQKEGIQITFSEANNEKPDTATYLNSQGQEIIDFFVEIKNLFVQNIIINFDTYIDSKIAKMLEQLLLAGKVKQVKFTANTRKDIDHLKYFKELEKLTLAVEMDTNTNLNELCETLKILVKLEMLELNSSKDIPFMEFRHGFRNLLSNNTSIKQLIHTDYLLDQNIMHQLRLNNASVNLEETYNQYETTEDQASTAILVATKYPDNRFLQAAMEDGQSAIKAAYTKLTELLNDLINLNITEANYYLAKLSEKNGDIELAYELLKNIPSYASSYKKASCMQARLILVNKQSILDDLISEKFKNQLLKDFSAEIDNSIDPSASDFKSKILLLGIKYSMRSGEEEESRPFLSSFLQEFIYNDINGSLANNILQNITTPTNLENFDDAFGTILSLLYVLRAEAIKSKHYPPEQKTVGTNTDATSLLLFSKSKHIDDQPVSSIASKKRSHSCHP